MNRRRFVGGGLAAGAAIASGCARPNDADAATGESGRAAAAPTARFRHSVTRWPFDKWSVEQLAQTAKELRIDSVELLEPSDWPTVKQHGLTCAMGYPVVPDPKTRLTEGWNKEANHAWLIPAYEKVLPEAAAAGVPNVICFSGNRAGLSDEAGLAACAKGLRQLMPAAEKAGVTVCMELLNSKVDHKDYQCDHTPWGAALVDRVGSERFRLLYDIYHMQIMEGDVIRTIRDHKQHIAHFHTAGVPGRHELDATQELQYAAIMRGIADTGFTGYVAQEFIPTRDPKTSLREAVELCRV